MHLLNAPEALQVTDAFLLALYGDVAYERWRKLKQEMMFTTESDYVNWLVDVAELFSREEGEGREEERECRGEERGSRGKTRECRGEEQVFRVEEDMEDDGQSVAGVGAQSTSYPLGDINMAGMSDQVKCEEFEAANAAAMVPTHHTGQASIDNWYQSETNYMRNLSRNMPQHNACEEHVQVAIISLKSPVVKDGSISKEDALAAGSHVLAQGATTESRKKRKSCTFCYRQLAEAFGRTEARRKVRTVKTFCASCPGQPYMCVECFHQYSFHRTGHAGAITLS